MIGLTPCFRQAVNSSTEPFITPGPVRPRARWSKDAARAASASTLHAPSSNEYSEWTWRWAQLGVIRVRFARGVGSHPSAGGSSAAGAVQRRPRFPRIGIGADAVGLRRGPGDG